MELDAFRTSLGIAQGHVVSDDRGVFVLGSMDPGNMVELAAGDHAKIMQEVDLTDIDLLQASFQIRVPAGLPDNLRWRVSMFAGNTVLTYRDFSAAEEKNISDLVGNVSKLTGTHQVGIELRLVEVDDQ